MIENQPWSKIVFSKPSRLVEVAVVLLLAVAGGAFLLSKGHRTQNADRLNSEYSSQAKRQPKKFRPSSEQWAGLMFQTVNSRSFQSKLVTEGKVAIDEDHSTPIFSPYSGRVTRIVVKPGDTVERGQLLFALEATDMVQAQNDFITTLAGTRNRAFSAQLGADRGEATA